MSTPQNDAEWLELVFAGTPDRVVSAVAGKDALHAVDTAREALAHYARTVVEPVAPSPALSNRIRERLAARPRHARREALVVLDMIEDYLTPGRPLHVPRARTIIPAVKARIDAARRDGTPVVYLHDHHEPGDPDLETWPLHAVAGSAGGRVIAELAPREGDVILPHRTYSAFFESDFDAVLRRLDVNAVVLTGCATEVGLLATATDALMRGYEVDVPADSQAGASETAEQVALGVLAVMRPLRAMRARE